MTARREVRGEVRSIMASAKKMTVTVACEPTVRWAFGGPVVLMHADDHAALVAEVEEWRANAAALMEEVRGYEAASASEHTTDTTTDAEGHTGGRRCLSP